MWTLGPGTAFFPALLPRSGLLIVDSIQPVPPTAILPRGSAPTATASSSEYACWRIKQVCVCCKG